MTASTQGYASGEIRAHMARKRKTSRDLAAILGVSHAAVYRRLSDQTEWTISELARVAEWLDVPIAALLPEDLVAS